MACGQVAGNRSAAVADIAVEHLDGSPVEIADEKIFRLALSA